MRWRVSEMHFEALSKRLRHLDDTELGSGVSEEEIVNAEKALGISIRGSFRSFLREFGWACPKTIELYGLGKDLPRAYLDLVSTTVSERTEMQPNIPHDLLPLMNDGYGNQYCLDLRHSDGEPEVVFWNHDHGSEQVPEVRAKNYIDWLDEMLDREEGES